MVEPDDGTLYTFFHLGADSYRLLLIGVDWYEVQLTAGTNLVTSNPTLKALFDKDAMNDGAIGEELRRVRIVRHYLKDIPPLTHDVTITICNITYQTLRYFKALIGLGLELVTAERNRISSNTDCGPGVAFALDAKINAARERAGVGIFAEMTPLPLLFHPGTSEPSSPMRLVQSSAAAFRVMADRLEFRDPELSKHCLDQLQRFSETGEHERLDSVVRDASTLLEVRLRKLSGAPSDTTGWDLISFAFGGSSPRILLSSNPKEHDAGQLLFRGFFGFVRNVVHHHLVDTFDPLRAKEVVGMVDYLLFVLEARTSGTAVMHHHLGSVCDADYVAPPESEHDCT